MSLNDKPITGNDSDENRGTDSDNASGDIAGSGETQAKRGRGRPRKSTSIDSGNTIDPATLSGDSTSGTSGDASARTRSNRKSKAEPFNLDALIGLLTTVQLGALAITGIAEIRLSEAENTELAKAVLRVSRHYPSVLTEKQQDIIALATTVGTIAFVHYSMFKVRTSKPAAQQETQGPIIENVL